MLTLVIRETVRDQLDITTKLGNFFVREDVVIVGRLQALLHESEQDAIGHVTMSRWHRVIGLLKYRAVLGDLCDDRVVNADAVGRLTEFRCNRAAFVKVQVEY